MPASNTLQEFLIRLGFKIDESQFRNFNETVRKTNLGVADLTKSFVGLIQSSALATSGLVAGVAAIAKPLEGLYYAAQRTGASAKELQSFAFAASQIGVSAEQAQSAIEGLAAARRTNPGLNGILSGMGIDPRQTDNAKVMVELLGKLHSMPHYQAAQVGGMFGISEQMLTQFERNGPRFVKMLALREKMFSQSGADPDKFDVQSLDFMNELGKMGAGLLDLSEIVAMRVMPPLESLFKLVERGTEALKKADQATNGLSSKGIALASMLGGLGVLKGGLGIVGRFAGGGAAAAGETVAGEAAGGVGALALPAIIIAAVGAALTWMTAHPEAVRKAVSSAAGTAWDATKKEANALPGQLASVVHSIGKVASDLSQQVRAGGGVLKTLEVQSGILGGPLGSLASMVAKSEGFAAKMYADHKGFSIGFGHLVKPGEDFSGGIDRAGALALLAKDLQTAMASVAKLVKVHLNENQSKALADFVFNLGEGNLAKSTLLKKLNAGDFAGAADQFERWNKVLVNGHYEVNKGLSDRRAADAQLFRSPDKSVTITQKTDIHVNDSGTGRGVAREQDQVNGDLVRNMVGATR